MKPTTSVAPSFKLPARYEFQNEILRGGQGEVYVCRDTSLDRIVAVKTLHDITDVGALTKEVEARAKIKSKHVAELYECLFDDKGLPIALVMEYVPGRSLDDPAVHPKDRDSLVRLLYQIASGIADIHEAGIIHRDIKPLNMKVDSAGILKIFDLGIANLDASSASTLGGAGTYVYRAPELYFPPPIRVTTAADVYAIGVIAWYLLTNRFPAPLLEIPPQNSRTPVSNLASVVPNAERVTEPLDRTLNLQPSERPTAAVLRDVFRSFATHASRRGVFSSGAAIHELKAIGTITRIEIQPFGVLRVSYTKDGHFVIRDVQGDIFVNNMPAISGDELPDSCVLTFGPVSAGGQRRFVPFDVSQPEIVL